MCVCKKETSVVDACFHLDAQKLLCVLYFYIQPRDTFEGVYHLCTIYHQGTKVGHRAFFSVMILMGVKKKTNVQFFFLPLLISRTPF